MIESLQGRLLLASPEMTDPNFANTVILLVQHSPEGAMGLVLNQPTDTTVRDAVEAAIGLDCETDEMVYRGGPCDGPLMALHGDPAHAQESVIDGVYFATEREHVEPMLAGDVLPVRFFAGYAGWGPLQLEGELAASAWTVVTADADTVFEQDAYLYERLMRQNRATSILSQFNPKLIPRDPSDN